MKFKAKTFNPRKHIVPTWAQGKVDGHRIAYSDGQALTTVGHDISARLDEIGYHWWEKMKRFPPGIVVEFEMFSPEHGAEYVKTALKHGHALDALAFSTTALPPDASLVEVDRFMHKYGLYTPDYFHAVNDIDAMLKWAEAARYEGLVLKAGNYEEWYKVKIEDTIDLIVTGFKLGRGKYIGLIGSLECSTLEGQLVCNCSGMSDAERLAIDEETDLGRVVEVKYQRVGSDGRLRHPRFVRWRDDKDASGCSISQDPVLRKIWREKNAST